MPRQSFITKESVGLNNDGVTSAEKTETRHFCTAAAGKLRHVDMELGVSSAPISYHKQSWCILPGVLLLAPGALPVALDIQRVF